MKIEELRVGNLVSLFLGIGDDGAEYKYYSVNGVMMQNGSEFYLINNMWVEISNNLEPIAITEEWLLKFGFESDSYANFYKKIATYAYLVVSFKDYACTQIRETISIDDHDIEANCKCVHQLQNLYFALTNQELTIKL